MDFWEIIKKTLGKKNVDVTDLLISHDAQSALDEVARKGATDVIIIYREPGDDDVKVAAAGSILNDDLAFYGMLWKANMGALLGHFDGDSDV